MGYYSNAVYNQLSYKNNPHLKLKILFLWLLVNHVPSIVFLTS